MAQNKPEYLHVLNRTIKYWDTASCQRLEPSLTLLFFTGSLINEPKLKLLRNYEIFIHFMFIELGEPNFVP